MTIRLSEGLRARMAHATGFARALHNGSIIVYAGAQPVSPEVSDSTFTKLGLFTVSSGALTKETRATATLTVTGVSGTLASVTIGTLPIVVNPERVVWTTDTTVTAALIRDAINTSGIARATSVGAVITLMAPPGVGAQWNTLLPATTGITCTAVAFASGVAAVNGLYLAQPAVGVIAKPASVVWSCLGLVAGTGGWFRFFSSNVSDTGGLITTGVEPLHSRMDGTVGIGSGDMQLSSLTFSLNSPHTVESATFTMPAA